MVATASKSMVFSNCFGVRELRLNTRRSSMTMMINITMVQKKRLSGLNINNDRLCVYVSVSSRMSEK